jgi:DNA-binding CsgD family transcriptional regulator
VRSDRHQREPGETPSDTDSADWVRAEGKRKMLTEAGRVELERLGAGGYSNPEIARAFGVSKEMIRRWRHQIAQ